jgi:hypothetical protein
VKRTAHSPKRKVAQSKSLAIKYDKQVHGWVIDGDVGRRKIFATKDAAENYCITKLKRCPIVLDDQAKKEYQDLPKRSVWTGAPWDYMFANIVK